MQNGAARFVWYELMTTDPEAAAGFYRSVLGWEPKPFEASPFPYLVLEAAGQGVAGIMALPEEARAGGMPRDRRAMDSECTLLCPNGKSCVGGSTMSKWPKSSRPRASSTMSRTPSCCTTSGEM